ncbi:MAG: RNA polymerase sigma factor [Longimicrobiales bacterium]|nr:RNA polymerase sigma factor [Longimicrobiales bacterium]
MSQPSPEMMALIRRAADGDEDAFRALVRRVHPRLRRWALAKTGDPDQADEAVQRTLIRMHRGLAGFTGESALTSWLYRILSNAVIDMHRSESARPTVREEAAEVMPERSEGPDPIQSIHAGRMARAVRDFFDLLPPRQREVLELVDHQGMKAVDVAEMLEIEPGSVRASLFKARRTLRGEILERYPELTEGYGP